MSLLSRHTSWLITDTMPSDFCKDRVYDGEIIKCGPQSRGTVTQCKKDNCPRIPEKIISEPPSAPAHVHHGKKKPVAADNIAAVQGLCIDDVDITGVYTRHDIAMKTGISYSNINSSLQRMKVKADLVLYTEAQKPRYFYTKEHLLELLKAVPEERAEATKRQHNKNAYVTPPGTIRLSEIADWLDIPRADVSTFLVQDNIAPVHIEQDSDGFTKHECHDLKLIEKIGPKILDWYKAKEKKEDKIIEEMQEEKD